MWDSNRKTAMPDASSSRLHKATGRDVGTGKVITLTKTQPAQLSLFGEFLPPDSRDSYSNTIELYDAIPKYFSSKKTMAELRRDGIFLKSLKRRFRHRDQHFELIIKPARLIDKNGQEKEYYPSHQEEIVEEALKKLACDRLNGVFLNDTAGVQFTLYELDSELKRQGHSMKWADLIASLEICRGAGIEVIGPEGKVEVKSSIFPVVALVNRAEWERNPKQVRCYVQFNPLVTYSINKLAFRQFDYATYMQLKNHLARWLFKHLSHYYTQASWDSPFSIMHSTIVSNSYLVNNAQRRDQVRYACQALDELKGKADVISHYSKKMILGPRNKIEDVKYTISPSLAFINQIKKANLRQREITQKALDLGVLTQEQLAKQYLQEARQEEENPSGRPQGTLLKYPVITRGSK
jgi:hypothetical protein